MVTQLKIILSLFILLNFGLLTLAEHNTMMLTAVFHSGTASRTSVFCYTNKTHDTCWTSLCGLYSSNVNTASVLMIPLFPKDCVQSSQKYQSIGPYHLMMYNLQKTPVLETLQSCGDVWSCGGMVCALSRLPNFGAVSVRPVMGQCHLKW